MKREQVISWISQARFEALPETARETALEQVLSGASAAPDVPTAGIWVLQKCGIKPTTEDLSRWSKDVAAKSAKRPR